jgi:hypothetical protein
MGDIFCRFMATVTGHHSGPKQHAVAFNQLSKTHHENQSEAK